MMETIAEIEQSLEALLTVRAAGNRENVLAVGEIRETFADTHRETAADQVAHGGDPSAPYWDLIMADASADEPALFAVAFWRENYRSLCVATGKSADVLEICNRSSMEEVEEVTAAMDARFRLSDDAIHIPRGLAEYWMSS
jgi:hypothetical protein